MKDCVHGEIITKITAKAALKYVEKLTFCKISNFESSVQTEDIVLEIRKKSQTSIFMYRIRFFLF